MADQKISELNAKTTVHDTDLFPMVDVEAATDETKKITGANLKKILPRFTADKILKGAGVDTAPTEIYLPEFTKNWLHEQWGTDPASATSGWTDAVVDSGNIYIWTMGRLGFSTGATSLGTIKLYSNATGGFFATGAGHMCTWFTQWADSDRTDSTAYFLIHISTGYPTISLTAHHLGFKIINGAIWSTTGDGAAEEAQDTGITYASQWAKHSLTFVYRTGAIDFYVDDVLKTTHSTYLPGISNGYMYLSLKTLTTADRKLDINGINMRCP